MVLAKKVKLFLEASFFINGKVHSNDDKYIQ